MGGGNGAKSHAARAKKQAKLDAAGTKSTADDRKKHQQSVNAVQCTVCLTGFPKTVREAELQQHIDSKHSKMNTTIAVCFPGFASP